MSSTPCCKKADLPRIRFHDLRHAAATLLLKQGVHPKIASETLGHSQVGITLDRYSPMLPDMQQGAVKAMEETFRQPPLSSELSSSKKLSEEESGNEEL